MVAIIQSKIFLSSCLISKNIKIKINKTLILPVVLYGCKTWSLTLREEDRSWRKLHNDKLHSLYSSSNIVREIKSRRVSWAGHVACMEEGEVFIEFWLGGPKVRINHWEDPGIGGKIKMELREIGINGANWIRLTKDRIQWWAFVIMVINLQVPQRNQADV
jgi:hypothetical protein